MKSPRASTALAFLVLASSAQSSQTFIIPGGVPSAHTAINTSGSGGNCGVKGGSSQFRSAIDSAGLRLTRVRGGGRNRGRGSLGVHGGGGRGGNGGWGAGRDKESALANRERRRSQRRRRRSRRNEGTGGDGSSVSDIAISAASAGAEVQDASPPLEDPTDDENLEATKRLLHHDIPRAADAIAGKMEWRRVPSAGELLVNARAKYGDVFGEKTTPGQVSAGYAPGRVNLIGEHTDYNGGFVMPLALDRGTVVYGAGRLVDVEKGRAENSKTRGSCRVVSDTIAESAVEDGLSDVSFNADEHLTPGDPEWANYVKGVVKEYMVKVPDGKSFEFTATVVGTVPLGGGVSSSASLCVATATFLDGLLANAGLSPPSAKEKAHLCRMAEHNFMNMPCGIMDQFVTSMAEPGHAMLLDCRSENPEAVPLADDSLVIVVTNSNVKHKLAGSQYPVRVAQCATARDEVQKRHPDVKLLRDASQEQLDEIENSVEEAVFRRARHVLTENARTVAAAEALRKRDYGAAGKYMVESHNSLREDYEVSCRELDVLVELAMEVKGVYGSRLTGGGFGGCTVTLADKDAVETLVSHLQEGYAKAVGRECFCFVTQPGFGARGLSGETASTASEWPNT